MSMAAPGGFLRNAVRHHAAEISTLCARRQQMNRSVCRVMASVAGLAVLGMIATLAGANRGAAVGACVLDKWLCAVTLVACGVGTPTDTVDSLLVNPDRLFSPSRPCRPMTMLRSLA